MSKNLFYINRFQSLHLTLCEYIQDKLASMKLFLYWMFELSFSSLVVRNIPI